MSQNLLTQYQARLIDLQQQAGVGPAPTAARMTNAGDVKETIRGLETENVSCFNSCFVKITFGFM